MGVVQSTSAQWPANPNQVTFTPAPGHRYLSTKVINHNGTCIAITLCEDIKHPHGTVKYFVYCVLDPQPEVLHAKTNSHGGKGGKGGNAKQAGSPSMLDAQGWPETPSSLTFPSAVRISGAAAVPSLELPAFDKTGSKVNSDAGGTVDPWYSTTIQFTDSDHFELVSDGKYVYLFRQSVFVKDNEWWKGVKAVDLKRYMNSNLLCDRFILTNGRLEGVLEVRYRRSGHKSLPLNDKDTLGVQDMNDRFFREPTISMPYINALESGRFTVIRTPTVISSVFKWIIFAWSSAVGQVQAFTIDTDADGLFDIRGRQYYTCSSEAHEPVFSTTPGPCTAIDLNSQSECGAPRVPRPADTSSTDCAISLGLEDCPIVLAVNGRIDLGSDSYEMGCVVEAWIRPAAPGNQVQLKEMREKQAAIKAEEQRIADQKEHVSTPVPSIPTSTVAAPSNPSASAVIDETVSSTSKKAPEANDLNGDADEWSTDDDPTDSGDESEEDESENGEDESDTSAPTSPDGLDGGLRLPSGSFYALFGSENNNGVDVMLDEEFHVVVINPKEGNKVVGRSSKPVKLETWNHVAVIYGPRKQSKRTITIVVNNLLSVFESDLLPSTLTHIGSRGSDLKNGFIGEIDEVRVWSQALHSASVIANSAQRMNGSESLLKACWHFDEGEGEYVHNATASSTALKIVPVSPMESLANAWARGESPPLSTGGLARKVMRFGDNFQARDGMHACVYYEQIPSANKTDPNAQDKPYKRNARVLFCSGGQGADFGGLDSYLYTLDFGIRYDGSLSDIPGSVRLPKLSLDSSKPGNPVVQSGLIHADPDNLNLYGGVFPFEQGMILKRGMSPAGTHPAPFVWESAAGTVSIYYKDAQGIFKSLPYRTSKPRESQENMIVSRHPQIRASLKPVSADKIARIRIQTDTPSWSNGDYVDLTLSATMKDLSVATERWMGLPCDLKDILRIVNGGDETVDDVDFIGELESISLENPSSTGASTRKYRLSLLTALTRDIPSGGCLKIGSVGARTVQAAKSGDTSLTILHPYELGSWREEWDPTKPDLGYGLIVVFVEYDVENLVLGNRTPHLGSRLASLALSPNINAGPISCPAISDVDCMADLPYFTAPPESCTLRLTGSQVVSMLDRVSPTPSSGALTFESWIAVNYSGPSSKIICAFKSTRTTRSPLAPSEVQTFVLSAETLDRKTLSLDFNVNNRTGRITQGKDMDYFVPDRWFHLAIATKTRYALEFDGNNSVDLGNASEFNLGEFTILMNFELDSVGRNEHTLLTKLGENKSTPVEIIVTMTGSVEVRFNAPRIAGDNKPEPWTVYTPSGQVEAGKPYRLFVTRRLINASLKDETPRQGYAVSIHVFNPNGTTVTNLIAPSKEVYEERLKANTKWTSANLFLPAEGGVPAGMIPGNDASILLGRSSTGNGLKGKIAGLWMFGAASVMDTSDISLTSKWPPADAAKSPLGAWSFSSPEGTILLDDTGRHDGKLKKSPLWTTSPFPSDMDLEILINGIPASFQKSEITDRLTYTPAGDHQISLGNVVCGNDDFRYFGQEYNFTGEMDELRIWDTRRTREQVCDNLFTRLTDITPEIAVYYPFDKLANPADDSKAEVVEVFHDSSLNCWHLKMLHGKSAPLGSGGAPIGYDAPCVRPALSSNPVNGVFKTIATTPCVTEYGDLSVNANGSMEGSFKRLYAFIESDNTLNLITGFKVGELITEWMSQIQTNPTLIGYIEGAPPIPTENYISSSETPRSAIKYHNATDVKCTYSSRREDGSDTTVSDNISVGLKWEVMAGMGVQTKISEGQVKGGLKASIEMSDSKVSNTVQAATVRKMANVRAELSGRWRPGRREGENDRFFASNTGVALVESEVADVFALRLKLSGTNQPLVAYQMRPNLDIPKDRNLVTFEINPRYTKQGCLDGKWGTKADLDYLLAGSAAPSDVSYFKPVEAYAERDRIRRGEEQLLGQYRQLQLDSNRSKAPQRTRRNICNSYVWTASGGTFEETTSNVDFVQQETSVSSGIKGSNSVTLDYEETFTAWSFSGGYDLMSTTSFNLMLTKDETSESTFELEAELPSPIDIHTYDEESDKFVKRPGAVESYRWMSFWMEPSTDATALFFNKVVDPKWLRESDEADAIVLRDLSDRLKEERGDARTQAWRVFHRCTYVNRVLDKKKSQVAPPPTPTEPESSQIGYDFGPSWAIIHALEPYARGAKDKAGIIVAARPTCAELYPQVLAQAALWLQVVDMLAAYVGVKV